MPNELFRGALQEVTAVDYHCPLALECTRDVADKLTDINHQNRYGERRDVDWWRSGSTVVKSTVVNPPPSRESTPVLDINDILGYVLLPDPSRFGTVYSFGYGEQNTIKLPKLSGVSRVHFRIYLKENGAWMIADLSTNGTHVNNEAIVGERARTKHEQETGKYLKEVALNPQAATAITVGQELDFRIHVINDPELYQEFRRRVRNPVTDVPPLASSTLSILPSFDVAPRGKWRHDADRWAAYYVWTMKVPPLSLDRSLSPWR